MSLYLPQFAGQLCDYTTVHVQGLEDVDCSGNIILEILCSTSASWTFQLPFSWHQSWLSKWNIKHKTDWYGLERGGQMNISFSCCCSIRFYSEEVRRICSVIHVLSYRCKEPSFTAQRYRGKKSKYDITICISNETCGYLRLDKCCPTQTSDTSSLEFNRSVELVSFSCKFPFRAELHKLIKIIKSYMTHSHSQGVTWCCSVKPVDKIPMMHWVENLRFYSKLSTYWHL